MNFKKYHSFLEEHGEEMRAIRHDIHQYPELGLEELRTSELVAQMLLKWGWCVERNIGQTGVVAQLKVGTGTKRLGIRADMDALPIDEQTHLPHGSKVSGVMHACGHDGHTAMLLGAAKYLAATRNFNGTLNLIFQPAEEYLGGAKHMMDDGLFKKYPCDAIFAMHNMPGFPAGTFVFRDGATMASSDYATIVINGSGGHGGSPHRATDPIVAAASIVMALQTIVSRNIDPYEMAVVTVGSIHGGKASNVIPDSVTLEVSVRATSELVRQKLQERIQEIVTTQAQSYNVEGKVSYRKGYPVLNNWLEQTNFARQLAIDMYGEQSVIAHGPGRPGSEDFAYMLEECPGAYLFIGNGLNTESPMLHNPHYDFNDAILPLGAAYWIGLAERYLG